MDQEWRVLGRVLGKQRWLWGLPPDRVHRMGAAASMFVRGLAKQP